ncbi:hypothetical protein J6590_022877 [Homalodisca vitripennis]|nr:hypothetical protein J6590_022877 [Homalodisca vitripennis]
MRQSTLSDSLVRNQQSLTSYRRCHVTQKLGSIIDRLLDASGSLVLAGVNVTYTLLKDKRLSLGRGQGVSRDLATARGHLAVTTPCASSASSVLRS